jgi:hypothetical protein
MDFSEIFNVCKFFALFIRQALPITTTNTTCIHKFIEKGNSQQSNNSYLHN